MTFAGPQSGAPQPGDPRSAVTVDPFALMFRGAAIPTLAVGVIAAVVAGVVAGGAGVLGALLGVGLVLIFFGLTLLVMRWTADALPGNAFGAAMISYSLKIVVLGVLLVVGRKLTWFDKQSFGLTVLACGVVWLLAEVRAFVRAPIPIIVPESGPK